MHHDRISVMKCFSIILGFIFDDFKSGEIRRPTVRLHYVSFQFVSSLGLYS